MEQIPDDITQWRNDIRDSLPSNIKWFVAEIEEKDLEKTYIISSDDWKNLTQTFKLLDVVDALNKGLNDDKIKNILAKRSIYESNINGLDRKFTLVSPSTEGNFTIIEGNKRAVALQSLNKLVGNQIYLGVSNKINNYWWARYSR